MHNIDYYHTVDNLIINLPNKINIAIVKYLSTTGITKLKIFLIKILNILRLTMVLNSLITDFKDLMIKPV